MHHPYREPPAIAEPPAERPSEETALHGLLIAIGLVPLAIAWLSSGGFGTQATLGALMVAAGAGGLARRTRFRHGK